MAFEAADVIRMNLESELTVQQKNGRTDLVTNMDEQTQEFLMNKIQTNFPEDQILGEEKGYNTLKVLLVACGSSIRLMAQ